MDQNDSQIVSDHYRAGRLALAEATFRETLARNPNDAAAHNNLGAVLKAQGRIDEAIDSFQRSIELNPGRAEAHFNLGNVLYIKSQLDESVNAYLRAIELKPDYAAAYSSLECVLGDQGRLDEIIALCRRAIQLWPDNPDSYVNLFFALYHHPAYDSQQLLEETRQWARRQPIISNAYSPTRDRNPQRRLKIGYLSPFFAACGEAHYILPLLAHHDRKRFEIFCYSLTHRDDDITERLRSHSDHWHELRQLDNPAIVELIRSHEIDILVTTSRPADKSAAIIASRLAPIQMRWLTYVACTTGLDNVDYRISDPFLDPPELGDAAYSEKTLRLPQTAWCYDPMVDPPPVQPSPSLVSGFITFGCLGRLSKLNPPVIRTWAEILRAQPTSRLHLLAVPGSHRDRLLTQFRELAVDPARIEFIGRQSRLDYLKQYNRIDITLDTWPFSGQTTSLGSLWMGVPVVTLSDRTSVSRCSCSALHNLGLPDLIAQSPEQYISIALQLSQNPAYLLELRTMLRPRMEATPLIDAPRFTLQMEELYRQTWRRWCGV